MAKKKEEMGVPAIVDSVETLEAKMKAMREAQKEFANRRKQNRTQKKKKEKFCG